MISFVVRHQYHDGERKKLVKGFVNTQPPQGGTAYDIQHNDIHQNAISITSRNATFRIGFRYAESFIHTAVFHK